MYCGALPFGAMKSEDGIPVPDTQERRISSDGHECLVVNCEGLKMAFELASHGKSDRQIAILLNSSGYRITGTHGAREESMLLAARKASLALGATTGSKAGSALRSRGIS